MAVRSSKGRCQEEQAKMKKWLADLDQQPNRLARFDGTVGSLIAIYEPTRTAPIDDFPGAAGSNPFLPSYVGSVFSPVSAALISLTK